MFNYWIFKKTGVWILFCYFYARKWDFETDKDYQTPTRKTGVFLINRKKIICHVVDFAVQSDYRAKLKEIEKLDN